MDQAQTTRFVSRFEPLLYVSAFTQKDFHYMSTQDLTPRNLHRGITTLYLKYITPLSNTITSTQRGIDTKPKHNHLYIKGTRHKAKPQSSLHKRDKAEIT